MGKGGFGSGNPVAPEDQDMSQDQVPAEEERMQEDTEEPEIKGNYVSDQVCSSIEWK